MPVNSNLLTQCREGSLDSVNSALDSFRGAYLVGGPPPPELVEVLRGCEAGLVVGRGTPTTALLRFFFDVLMYIPGGLRTPGRGPAAALVDAIDGLGPRLSELRRDEDPTVARWAWHLASWLPTPVPNVAAEALDALSRASDAPDRITLALAAASTPDGRVATSTLLQTWLEVPGDTRSVAAIVLTQLHGDARDPARTPEACVDALVALAEGARWEGWELAPAREFGFYADVAGCLVRAGFARAERTMPALLRIVRVCSAAELDPVLGLVLQLLYQSSPYDGDPTLETLSPLQRSTLLELLAETRAWAPRPRFYATLSDLGLPVGATPMAAFLGVAAPENGLEIARIGEDGTLTVKSDRTPLELAQSLLGGPAPRA